MIWLTTTTTVPVQVIDIYSVNWIGNKNLEKGEVHCLFVILAGHCSISLLFFKKKRQGYLYYSKPSLGLIQYYFFWFFK